MPIGLLLIIRPLRLRATLLSVSEQRSQKPYALSLDVSHEQLFPAVWRELGRIAAAQRFPVGPWKGAWLVEYVNLSGIN